MKKFGVECMFWLAAATLATAASAADVPRLSAAQIVEKNAAARGGLQAWRAVKAMTVTGEMDAGGSENARLPYVMTLQRPNLTRLELKFQDQVAVQVYDGKQGWKLRPYLNRSDVEPYKPAELQLAAAVPELDGNLIDAARKGSKVELAGTEPVEGKPAYRLQLTLKNGEHTNVWVDAASFLEVKADGAPRRMDGRMRKVWVYYRDYRKVDGVMVAHTEETAVEGYRQTHKITVKSVTLNPKLAASTFAKPAATAAAL